jgi:hypothetical protein
MPEADFSQLLPIFVGLDFQERVTFESGCLLKFLFFPKCPDIQFHFHNFGIDLERIWNGLS